MKKRVYFLIKEILTIHSLLSSSSEGVTKVNFSVAFRSLTSLAKCRFLALSRDFRRQMRHMKMNDNLDDTILDNALQPRQLFDEVEETDDEIQYDEEELTSDR